MHSGIFDTGIGDQLFTFAFLPCCMKRKSTHKNIRDHSESCLEALQISVTNDFTFSESFKAGWGDCSDFDERFSLFSSELYKLCDSCFPIRTKVVSVHMLSKP